jgi:hypothetical protein
VSHFLYYYPVAEGAGYISDFPEFWVGQPLFTGKRSSNSIVNGILFLVASSHSSGVTVVHPKPIRLEMTA